jgi:hypothetical protein
MLSRTIIAAIAADSQGCTVQLMGDYHYRPWGNAPANESQDGLIHLFIISLISSRTKENGTVLSFVNKPQTLTKDE